MNEQAEAIHIDPEKIPAFRREELVRCILSMMRRAFAVPGEEARYQQWLAERRLVEAAMEGADNNGVLLDLP